jgi:hypothetical protein
MFCVGTDTATSGAISSDGQVLARKGVPIDTMRLASPLSRGTVASSNILGQSYYFHVSGVDTGRIATEVIEGHAIRDRSNVLFVIPAMGKDRFSVAMSVAVFAVHLRTQPLPATSGWVYRVVVLATPVLMPVDKTYGLTLNVAPSAVILCSDRRRLATAAHAQA